MTAARRVDELDVEELPRGKVSRLLLELVHDGLGRPLELPVLVARGERRGPVFGVTAAVHGNELNGIPIIHRLFDKLDPKHLRGSVVALVAVNLPGLLERSREVAEEIDLNRIMPGRPDGDSAQVYAHRLLERAVHQFDYLVDLHTASAGRENSLYVRADMTDAPTAQMAYLQRPQIIVHSPPADGTLRGATSQRKVPSITLEIGTPQRFQPEYVRSSLVGLRSVMGRAKMLPKRPVSPGAPPILCERAGWMYTDHGGFLEVLPRVTHRVEEGEVIARLTDVFGDVIREYRAPESGVVVGRSTDPVAPTGARILNLGVEASPGDPRFVARTET